MVTELSTSGCEVASNSVSWLLNIAMIKVKLDSLSQCKTGII